MATKYWIAGNPNGEVTNAQVEALKGLSTSDLAEVESVLSNIPQEAETAAAAATAAVGDSDNTEILADVAAIRTTLNSILVKLKAAKITL
jgi:hypothetical protein